MRVGLVSFEYFGQGGIGTYTRNASRMLVDRGHSVVVFTSLCGKEIEVSDVDVQRISAVSRKEFREAVGEAFAKVHASCPFDVVEVPEYGAEGAEIVRRFPDLPVVTRLHTPTFVLERIWREHISLVARFRFFAGAVRRGRLPKRPWNRPDTSGEKEATLASDIFVGPSQSVLDSVADNWSVPSGARMVVPNVFYASEDLLRLDPSRQRNTVIFLGRLEVRKGVLDLAQAVPMVCSEDSTVRFLFIGKSLPLPASGRETQEEMKRIIGRWQANVRFVDDVPNKKVPDYFAAADVAAFPSIWESFGYVCLEAMAAGCGVIGSAAGGMAEMIDEGRTGFLVHPRNPTALAEKILEMIQNPPLRANMGRAARAHVLEHYGPEAIGPLQEKSYKLAMARARDYT